MEGSRQLAASRLMAEQPGFEPTVSVIIPAYNEEGAVEATVESVRSELTSAGISHEIIVVKDGSSDDTAAVVRSWSTAARRTRWR